MVDYSDVPAAGFITVATSISSRATRVAASLTCRRRSQSLQRLPPSAVAPTYDILVIWLVYGCVVCGPRVVPVLVSDCVPQQSRSCRITGFLQFANALNPFVCFVGGDRRTRGERESSCLSDYWTVLTAGDQTPDEWLTRAACWTRECHIVCAGRCGQADVWRPPTAAVPKPANWATDRPTQLTGSRRSHSACSLTGLSLCGWSAAVLKQYGRGITAATRNTTHRTRLLVVTMLQEKTLELYACKCQLAGESVMARWCRDMDSDDSQRTHLTRPSCVRSRRIPFVSMQLNCRLIDDDMK